MTTVTFRAWIPATQAFLPKEIDFLDHCHVRSAPKRWTDLVPADLGDANLGLGAGTGARGNVVDPNHIRRYLN